MDGVRVSLPYCFLCSIMEGERPEVNGIEKIGLLVVGTRKGQDGPPLQVTSISSPVCIVNSFQVRLARSSSRSYE